MFANLPNYQGPHKVGFVDIESNPDGNSPLRKGVLFRLYYPTSTTSAPKQNWLPDGWFYSKGYGNFLNIPTYLVSTFIYPFLVYTKLAAFKETPLETASLPTKLPVVVFSHGLAGMRTTYSNLCGNLASRGFIVAAIEHGDGSACATVRHANDLEIPYHHPAKEEVLDGETETEYALRFRRSQLTHRKNEVYTVLELLKRIDSGDDSFIYSKDESKKNTLLNQFQNRFDFDNKALVGHSFGGATSIHVLEANEIDFKCAVILDPWMHAVNPEAEIHIPHMNLQSHVFHWKSNLDAVQRLVERSKKAETKVAYIKDTKHNDASDFGLLYPKIMSMAKQCGSNPVEAHKIQDSLIYGFIQKYLQVPVKIQEAAHERVVFDETAFEDLYNVINSNNVSSHKMKYTKQPSKLQKPMNSFFHYRKAKKQEIISKFNITKSHEISRKAAELWKSESASVKEYFKEISMNEHSAFKQRHPNYDWQPWKTRLKKNKVDSYLLSPQSTSESHFNLASKLNDL
ncbi:Platelet-activating factor acetylhydrolase [Boothiomyces sp. JEL0838]|nr:Platelet-activating factor acetylhydrolase [Boothiomyces sp. JEL0838]